MVKRQQKPKFKSPRQRWKNDGAEKIFYDIYKQLPANVKKKPDAHVAAECHREALRLYPGRNGQQRWQRSTEAMLKKLPVLKERSWQWRTCVASFAVFWVKGTSFESRSMIFRKKWRAKIGICLRYVRYCFRAKKSRRSSNVWKPNMHRNRRNLTSQLLLFKRWGSN